MLVFVALCCFWLRPLPPFFLLFSIALDISHLPLVQNWREFSSAIAFANEKCCLLLFCFSSLPFLVFGECCHLQINTFECFWLLVAVLFIFVLFGCLLSFLRESILFQKRKQAIACFAAPCYSSLLVFGFGKVNSLAFGRVLLQQRSAETVYRHFHHPARSD